MRQYLFKYIKKRKVVLDIFPEKLLLLELIQRNWIINFQCFFVWYHWMASQYSGWEVKLDIPYEEISANKVSFCIQLFSIWCNILTFQGSIYVSSIIRFWFTQFIFELFHLLKALSTEKAVKLKSHLSYSWVNQFIQHGIYIQIGF